MKFPFRSVRQSGDTIVEVLLAIAVISAVLVGAFLVTQRSTLAVRSGQEHSEMLQILQGQVEHVRAMALDQTTDTGGIFAAGNFCIDTSNPPNYIRIDATKPNCNNFQKLYHVKASYDATNHIFTFIGTWEKLGGGSTKTNQEILTYRVYSGKLVEAAPETQTPGTPDDPDDGSALFDDNDPCGHVGQPACKGYVVGGEYHYRVTYYNQSTNDQSKVTGCSWNWGDGSPTETFGASAPQCQYGEKSSPHTYPKVAEKPYPQSCDQMPYTVTLIMFIKGVTNPPHWDKTIRIPYCDHVQ